MSKKVTLKDLAEKLDLSQNTISQILRNRPGFSDETRKLVLNTAKDMGYKTKKTIERENICLITPHRNRDTYYYTNFRQAIDISLQAEGFNIITINNVSDSDLENIENICESHKIKGIIIVGDIGKRLVLKIMEMSLPIICAGFSVPGVALNYVLEDDISGVFMLLEVLESRGYKEFGYIGDINDRGFFNRWMAAKAYIYKKNLTLLDDAVFINSEKGSLDNVKTLTPILKNIDKKPEIFLCGNDLIAMATIKSLTFLDYHVPEDIGVVGFDNTEIARLSIPNLATVDNYVDQQADAITNRMIDLIKDPILPTQTIMTPVKFVDGDSIKKNR